MSGVRKQRLRWDLALVYGVFCNLVVAGSVKAECISSECMAPKNSSSETYSLRPAGTCFNNSVDNYITCTIGFQQTGTGYKATCKDGNWEREGSCDIDVLSLIIAVIIMLVIVSVFSLFIVCLCQRSKLNRTSLDTSEVIDGHLEDGGVVNTSISMNEIQPSPRVIAIEPHEMDDDPHEMDDEAGNTTSSSDATVPVDVHSESEFAREDMLGGYGVIGENPLTPEDPQAGGSTEHLIDMTRDEPDGQASLEPYGTLDHPLTRNRDLETTVGGSVKVKPVTVHPSVSKKSASVRNYGPNDSDEVDVNALYAQINRVKRASSRWPPGQKDKKPTVSTEGWNHIDDAWNETEKYPTEPATGERIKEGVYAELNRAARDSVRSSNEDTSTSKKIPPEVAKKPKSHKAKRSALPSGDGSALYARVDRSRHSSKSSILDSNFDLPPPPPPPPPSPPPPPPPIDGAGGLYAQIDRDRNSKENLTQVGVTDDDVRVE